MTKEKAKEPQLRFKGFTDAWEQRKLGETLAELKSGLSRMLSDVDIGLPVVRANNINEGQFDMRSDVKYWYQNDPQGAKTENYLVKEGDILINFINSEAKMGTATIVQSELERETIYTTNILKAQTNDDYDNNFWFALTLTNDYKNDIKRITKPAVNQASFTTVDFKELIYYFPSFGEQRKIGECFKNLDHLITLHQRKCDLLSKAKKTLLQKMFPKNGETTPEIRFKRFMDVWEQRKVKNVADRYDNLRVPIAANLRVAGSIPYYGANGIQDYVEGFTHDGEFVLVAEDGANDLKNYPVKYVKGRIWVNNHAHVLKGKTNICNNRFLACSISQAEIESLLVGGGRAKLNADTMMNITLSLPTLEEQDQIGGFFQRLDHLITLHQHELEKLQNIKKSCLKMMFV